ncbi:MAG TPA: MFS transporter [Nitrolancea sp.]|nr:MFS transporter [Nitrolancea sp.]
MQANTAAQRSLISVIAADGLSRFGSAMTALAIPWFVLVTSNSVARTSVAVFAGAAGMVVALLLGGAAVDRLSFARASIFADLLAGSVIAFIPLLYLTVGLPFWLLLILVFAGALFDTPAGVARYSALPGLARQAAVRFERANAIEEAVITISALCGPALAGVLIAMVGAANVLWIDAMTFALSAGLMLSVARRNGEPESRDATHTSYLGEILDALRFVQRDAVLFPLILFFGVMNLAIGPIEALFVPVVARDVYHSAYALGLLSSALAIGALGGNAIFGLIGERLPRHVVFSLGFLVVPLCFLILAFEPPFVVAIVTLGLVGLALSFTNFLEYIIYFERIPESMRAKGLGVTGAIGSASVPIGRLLAGAGLAAFGLAATLGGFALLFAPVPLFMLVAPVFRELRAPRLDLPRS